MTDPFDACRVAYEQGRRDALAEAVQRVERACVTYSDHVEALRQAEQRLAIATGALLAVVREESYTKGQRDERERIRAACIEMKHRDGCACDVIDTLNRIDAAPRVSGRQP